MEYFDPRNCARIFGRNLTRIMAERGITQRDLSFESGMPASQISKYMSGMVNPTFHILFKLSSVIGCSMDNFTVTNANDGENPYTKYDVKHMWD